MWQVPGLLHRYRIPSIYDSDSGICPMKTSFQRNPRCPDHTPLARYTCPSTHRRQPSLPPPPPPPFASRTNQPINPHNLCDRLPESFRILGIAGCHHGETAQRVNGGQGEVTHGVVETDVFRIFTVTMVGNACDWFDLLTNRLEI